MSMPSSPPRLSAIIPLRNRSGDRLRNCLHSLRWQEGILSEEFEVIIVDFGSDQKHQEAIQNEAEKWNVRVVRVEEMGVWNRSKALNYGIRHAQGDYLFCTDVDMIFSPQFIRNLMDRMDQKHIVFSKCQDLPETVPMQTRHKDEFDWLVGQTTTRSTQGTGACQCAHRSFFYHAHGYDEKFQHWGAEDDDFKNRAFRFGLIPVWMPTSSPMLHQWHPTTRTSHTFQQKLNKYRLYLTRWKIVKNRMEWGGQPSTVLDSFRRETQD